MRITTPFDATSTAAEVVRGIDLSGKRIVVTGGASGIGVETARALAGAGAEVVLAVRDVAAGARVAADITRTTGNGRVTVRPLDLADLASVRAFVAAWAGPLHVLVNNAGVMACPEQRTRDGWELQLATNHLGHFALADGLRRALAAAGGARVVSVSSCAHVRSPVVFDDLHFERRPYEPWSAYGQSKTANVLFAVEVTARWRDDGITSNALMPGGIATNLQRHLGGATYMAQAAERFRKAGRSLKTPEQGAATSVLLATSPLLECVGGRYFEDCNEALPHDGTSTVDGVAAWALDREAAGRLWTLSERAIGAR
ncbi:short-chain dehydrogenase/reductase SDR [Anaeromyxobacter sp. K]|uniref:SDR family NAD(P)-dependent oxidoreductase n=1 Tax=Anaeromyxobacter sp. (strain K) TaxID=447217 RepID=UPI00015F9F51|nr:SDR family NAD(P)-dependent oxidoreductase [Anaeromyxobacter sp. K]ACG73672.1 short-chain dehydrogenase/reductase SDR [Anaeromyxobacter sp. K]